MDYELAKELKDAGFPKSQLWEEAPNGDEFVFVDDDGRAVPTLSELIEACPQNWFILDKDGKGWGACDNDEEGNEHCAHANKTPEEAVARLWLALNKK